MKGSESTVESLLNQVASLQNPIGELVANDAAHVALDTLDHAREAPVVLQRLPDVIAQAVVRVVGIAADVAMVEVALLAAVATGLDLREVLPTQRASQGFSEPPLVFGVCELSKTHGKLREFGRAFLREVVDVPEISSLVEFCSGCSLGRYAVYEYAPLGCNQAIPNRVLHGVNLLR